MGRVSKMTNAAAAAAMPSADVHYLYFLRNLPSVLSLPCLSLSRH